MKWETKQPFGGKLCQEYSYQKLLKSDNRFSSYSQKRCGCFSETTVFLSGWETLQWLSFAPFGSEEWQGWVAALRHCSCGWSVDGLGRLLCGFLWGL